MDKKAAAPAVQEESEVQAEDEGHIELVLRCLASMCDGQNTVLQVQKSKVSSLCILTMNLY